MNSSRVSLFEVRFTVSGVGEFPFDMLRYDGCHPVSSTDVAAMFAKGRRDVNMIGYTTRRGDYPTKGRWESFLWRVTSLGNLTQGSKGLG